MTNKISDWKWCLDFSDAVGQKDSKIAPGFYLTRKDARRCQARIFPKGRIVKVKISIVKGK